MISVDHLISARSDLTKVGVDYVRLIHRGGQSIVYLSYKNSVEQSLECCKQRS